MFGADEVFLGYRGVGRDVTLQSRAENMLAARARSGALARRGRGQRRGLKAVILALCEAEGWDSGRLLPARGGRRAALPGRLVRSTSPAVARFVEGARMDLWQSGNAVLVRRCVRARAAEGRRSMPPTARSRSPSSRTAGPSAVLAFSGAAWARPMSACSRRCASSAARSVNSCAARKQKRRLREGEARFPQPHQMSSDFFWESDTQHRVTKRRARPELSHTEIGLGAVGKRPLGPAVDQPRRSRLGAV